MEFKFGDLSLESGWRFCVGSRFRQEFLGFDAPVSSNRYNT